MLSQLANSERAVQGATPLSVVTTDNGMLRFGAGKLL